MAKKQKRLGETSIIALQQQKLIKDRKTKTEPTKKKNRKTIKEMATGNATHPPLTALLFLYYRVRVPRLPRSKRIQAKKKGKKHINQVLHQSERNQIF